MVIQCTVRDDDDDPESCVMMMMIEFRLQSELLYVVPKKLPKKLYKDVLPKISPDPFAPPGGEKTCFQIVCTPFWDLSRGGTDRPRSLQERGGTGISRDSANKRCGTSKMPSRNQCPVPARVEQSDRHNSVTA